jgi:predicted ATPase
MGLYISRLRLFNWKNFHECDVNISPRCFIIGANAAGKSNLLDAIRFLRDIARQGGGLQNAVEQRGGVTKIRCLAARQRTDIFIETELRDMESGELRWKYSLKIKNVGGGIMKNQAEVLEEIVYDATKRENILRRSSDDEKEDTETLKYTHLEQATVNGAFRAIRNAFSDVEYLNVIPQLVRESGSTLLTSGKEDYYGRNFLNRLSLLPERTRKSYLNRISKILSSVVPQLEELSFKKDDMGIPHIEARYKHWRKRGSKQDETVFSDGTLRLIGFLFAMSDGNGIILLEEPEINLNSGIVEQMPEYIASIQRSRKRQVFVTTHSYEMLSNEGIRMSEVLVLDTSDEGTKVEVVSNIPSLKAIIDTGMSVGDAVMPYVKPSTVSQMNVQ